MNSWVKGRLHGPYADLLRPRAADIDHLFADSNNLVREVRRHLLTGEARSVREAQLRDGLLDLANELERFASKRTTEEVEPATLDDLPRPEIITGTRSYLQRISWLQCGIEASRGVCRVIKESGGQSVPLASGFLIGNGLMATNNHVLASRDDCDSAFAEFNFEEDIRGKIGPTLKLAVGGLTNPHFRGT